MMKNETRASAAACIILVLAACATAQTSDFVVGPNWTATCSSSPYNSYLFELESLKSNWMVISVPELNCDSARVAALVDSAHQRGIKVALVGVPLDTGGMMLPDVSAGMWHRHESETDLHLNDETGQRVFGDHLAVNGESWKVTSNDSGWIQTAPVEFWRVVGTTMHTAVYRLRVQRSGQESLPVCRLAVTEQNGTSNEVTLRDTLLYAGSFPDDSTQYVEIPLYFEKGVDDSVAVYRFKVQVAPERSVAIWSDNVELFDTRADGLLRGSRRLAYKASDAAARFYTTGVYRYMLKDEPTRDQMRCWKETKEAVEAGAPAASGISWVALDVRGGDLSYYRDFVAATSPREMYADAYPLYGRTYDNQDTSTGHPGRVPVDSGVRFQVYLDSMCIVLDSARSAALIPNPPIPLWFDIQAFGEAMTSPAFNYNSEWNTRAPTCEEELIWREPTPRELRCMTWLALAYGAKGISYWLLSTTPGVWPPPPASPLKYFFLMGLLGFQTTSVYPYGYPMGHRPLFDTIAVQNSMLQGIGQTLMGLQSRHVRRWNGTHLDFILDADSAGVSDSLLHFGTFNGPDGLYFAVVNRRCLPSESIRRTVTVACTPDSEPNARLCDLVTGEIITGNELPSPGEVVFDIHLLPGQGRLFRLTDCRPMMDSWSTAASVPVGQHGKRVRDGGSLATDAAETTIYALKGNRTCELYAYNRDADEWTSRESIPAIGSSGRKKLVRKGAAMTWANGRLYALKGNNSLELWAYTPGSGSWMQMADVPAGNMTVREGAGLCAVPTGDTAQVYFLKGSNTREFYRYNTVSNTWETLEPAPLGVSNRPFRGGSCIAYDARDTVVYALKGRYNEFYRYDVGTGNWSSRTSLPLIGSLGRKKKAKEGAGLARVGRDVYCLKSGHTTEFWRYSIAADTWRQQAGVPIGPASKTVDRGGALVESGSRLYALKGNNTTEFHVYHPGGQGTLPGSYQPGQAGPNEVQVLSGANVASPVWSPDGDEVAFIQQDAQCNTNLYRTTTSGDSAIALAQLGQDCSDPVYSPDGSTIAFLLDDSSSHATQLAIVSTSGGTPMVLTGSPFDKGRPNWHPDGNLLVYAREDTTTGYEQVFVRPTTMTGSEVRLTDCNHDHACPVFRGDSEIVATATDEDGWNQVVSLTLNTIDSSWTETFVTSTNREHEAVIIGDTTPNRGGSGHVPNVIFCQLVDEDGFTRIARVDSAEAGGEVLLSPSGIDCFGLTASQDGATLHALKQTASGTQLGRIDPVSGGFSAITDDAVERGVPDVGADNALCVYSSVFSRDEGLFRCLGDPMTFAARAEVVINPIDTTGGDTIPNRGGSGHVPTCVPLVVLKAVACDSSCGWADSMRVSQVHCSGTETLTSTSDWQGYESLSVVSLGHGDGVYRVSVRFLVKVDTSCRDTSLVLADSCVMDRIAPGCSLVINHHARFTNAPECTLSVKVFDPDEARTRFGNNRLRNFLANSGFADDASGWSGQGYAYSDSLELVSILVQDTPCLYQDIPAETLYCGLGTSGKLRLAADIVADGLLRPGELRLTWRYAKYDTGVAGLDTLESTAGVESLALGFSSRVSRYNLEQDCDFTPQPPEGYLFAEARAGLYFSPGSESAGQVYVDDLRLDAFGGPGLDSSEWQTFDTLDLWQLTTTPGKKVVYAQVQDAAGNEGRWGHPSEGMSPVEDSIILDNSDPVSVISFPTSCQVINDTLLEIIGQAYDPDLSDGPGYFLDYKLAWSTSSTSESCFGILPESLFYTAQPPTFSGDPHLAWWNILPILTERGNGYYHLRLTVRDSAGNQSTTGVTVYLTDDTNLDGLSGSTDNSALAHAATEHDLLVGTTTGKLIRYTETELDSQQTTRITDSTGPAVITGITEDSTGKLWFSDLRDKHIRSLPDSGTTQDTIGNPSQLTGPNCVKVAKNGDFWVADRIRNVIRCYGPTGSLKHSFGSTGSEEGQFQGAYGLATDNSDRVYVADKGNHRIQVFDTLGNPQTTFGESILSQPGAIAVDTNKCCFVADPGQKAVFAFNPRGNRYLTIRPDDTILPIAVTLSKDNGWLYTIDQKHHTLSKYRVSYTDSASYGGAQGSPSASAKPKQVELYPGYPNPAKRSMTIRYAIPALRGRPSEGTSPNPRVRLSIYDITGRQVKTLVNNLPTRPGYYNLTWNCTDQRNQRLAAGVYFCRLVVVDEQNRIWSSAEASHSTVRTRKLVVSR